MTTKSIEERLRHLEKLEKRVQMLEDIHLIQNLMSKERYLDEATLFDERWQLLAQKTPGVTVEIGARGVFEGLENTRKTMVLHQEQGVQNHAQAMRKAYPDENFSSDRAGWLQSSVLGTPVIEIAGDGKTAKGLWVAYMIASTAAADSNKPPYGHWVWWKIGADFVKEDGVWKIWHLMLDPLCAVFPKESWSEGVLNVPPQPPAGGAPWENKHKDLDGKDWVIPGKPCSDAYTPYRRDYVPQYHMVPEPYETFYDENA